MQRLMRNRTILFVVVSALVLAVGAVVMAALFGEKIPLFTIPVRLADAVRVLIFAECTFALGQMLRLLADWRDVDVDERDQLVAPLALAAVWVFGLILYVAVDVAERFGKGGVDYKAPLALFVLAAGVGTIGWLRSRISRALARAKGDGERKQVMLTLKETTGHANIDLMKEE